MNKSHQSSSVKLTDGKKKKKTTQISNYLFHLKIASEIGHNSLRVNRAVNFKIINDTFRKFHY